MPEDFKDEREQLEVVNTRHYHRGVDFLKQFSSERLVELEEENDRALDSLLTEVRVFRPLSFAVQAHAKQQGRAPEKMLDVGSGECRAKVSMEEMFPGLEYEGVEVIRHLARMTGAIEGRVEDIPGESQYQLVVANHVLEHSFDIVKTLGAIWRLLPPGGLLAHATPTSYPDTEVAHVTQLRVAEWVQLYLSNGFGVLHVHEQNIVCPEVQMVLLRLE